LALTAAELAFILSLTDETQRRRAQERLRLPDDASGETVVRDGLGSLAVRDLARGVGSELALAAPVASVLSGLAEPTLWVEISAFTEDAVDAAHLYAHDRGMFLLSPRAYATFEVRGVRAGVTPVDLLLSVARRVLGGLRPALVACRVASTGSVAVAGLPDGSWAVSGDAAGSERPAATLEDALREFRTALATLSSAMTTA
jgi:hypothetical protein